MAKVSVFLPTFNRPKMLAESVASVLLQEGVDFELLILDNGSERETGDFLSTINDPRVSVFRFEKNAHPWEFLFNQSTGDYFVLWTDDDVMETWNLAAKASMLDANPEMGCVFSPVTVINPDGEPFGPQNDGVVDGEVTFSSLFRHNVIPMPSAMTRRGMFPAFWMESLQFKEWADWAFWLNVAKCSRIGYIPERLGRLRIHTGSETVSLGIRAGHFLPLYPRIWSHWIQRGHSPSQEDWEEMRRVYLVLADATFEALKGGRFVSVDA